MTVMRPAVLLLGLALLAQAGMGQKQAPPLLEPDDRYKADVLLIVAHPDDDVVIGGYLARIAIDDHKRVAVVYCTNGDGGGNSVGNEAGASLGLMREMEARRALGAFGIENIWFLGGHDTPGQNPLRSLDNWGHGKLLGEIVRLVRMIRPEVVLTWLPEQVVGENHGDHQASSVLAVEAFDASGDSTQFSEQVSPARDRTGMANLTEGLLPWQPKKLYFFSDAFEDFGPYWHDRGVFSPFRKSIVDGTGPTYDATTISTARHETYAKLTAEQQVFYKTQEGNVGDKAFASGQFADFEYPVHLIFGKSLVGGSATGDVFEGIHRGSAPFARVHGYTPEKHEGITVEIGDPWRFYAQFWKAHDLEALARLIPVPEMEADLGSKLIVDLLACNHTESPVEVDLGPMLPPGWKDQTATMDAAYFSYPVRPGECYPIQEHLAAPVSGQTGWQQLHWVATVGDATIGNVDVRVFVGKSGGLPQ